MVDINVLIRQYADMDPQRPAIADDEATLTYAQLHKRIGQWKQLLSKRGIRPGDAVLLVMCNRSVSVEVFLALYAIDAIIIPLNDLWTAHDIMSLYEHTDAKLLIGQWSLFSPVAKTLNLFSHIQFTLIKQLEKQLTGMEPCWAQKIPKEHELIFFTSGTTGKPKGIVIPKEAFLLSIDMDFLSDEATGHLFLRPLYFRSHLTMVCSVLQEGNTVVLIRDATPEPIYKTLEALRITRIIASPMDLNKLVNALQTGRYSVPAYVTEVVTTGKLLPTKLKAKIKSVMPHVQLIDFYGTSEAGGISSISDEEWEHKKGSVGKAAFFVDCVLIDELGERVDTGQVGELCIQSKFMMKEYYKAPEWTINAFYHGYLRTGDLGRFDEEGYFYMLGRKQEALQWGDPSVYLLEMEDQLWQCPFILDIAILTFDADDHKQYPAAFIKPCKSWSGSLEQLREEICSYLQTPHVLIPERIIFVQEIPYNQAGKPDRSQLLKEVHDG